MKVAIIGPQGLPVPPVKGGAIETLIDVILKENEKQQELEIDIYTVYDKAAIEASKNYQNVNFIFLLKHKKYTRVRNKFISLLRKVFKIDVPYTYATQICKYLKKYNYDKVLIEGDSSLVLPIEKIVGKEKVILHIHHDPRLTNHLEFRTELLHCNKILAVSNYVKEGLYQCINDKSYPIKTLLNCTNTKKFNKKLYRNQNERIKLNYKFNNEEIVIMFTGRLVPQKGVKELLYAFKGLAEIHNHVKLLIVGSSGFGNYVETDYERELIEIVSEIQDKVIFTGFINNNDLPIIHSICDIAIVPSLYGEAAGLVVIEALASGLPLVVTNIGGIPEYINDECAFVIENTENIVQDIQQALEMLIVDERLRFNMSESAHNHGQKFSEDRFYTEFIRVLND